MRTALDRSIALLLMLALLLTGAVAASGCDSAAKKEEAAKEVKKEEERDAKKECWSNQRTIEGQANAYYADEERFPADAQALVAAGYLNEAPACPTKGASAYGSIDASTGILTVSCEHGHF